MTVDIAVSKKRKQEKTYALRAYVPLKRPQERQPNLRLQRQLITLLPRIQAVRRQIAKSSNPIPN
jgi:hypothetical protein